MPTIKGLRPRPRVILLGKFEAHIIKAFESLFPTIWEAESTGELNNIVSPDEIDLIIISPGVQNQMLDNKYYDRAHLICFSNVINRLPGPSADSYIVRSRFSATEECIITDQPLGLYSLLENNLSDKNAKGRSLLDFQIHVRGADSFSDDLQLTTILEGALLQDPHTRLPFATKFIRLDSKLGIAWLPCGFFDVIPWVEIICQEWAIGDQERLPNFGDWTKYSEWMTHEEELLKLEIDSITDELKALTVDYKKRISELNTTLLETSLHVNKGKRRLISAQGDELLQETATAFEELGYLVRVIDQELEKGIPKKEDLRIQDPDVTNWEAIVEVRGHAKSSGQTSDLGRLSRFARLYHIETGHPPNKLLYVVNGQIELPSPLQRQEPFSSAPDDVAAFGEQDGLIIWTVNLFKILKETSIKGNISEIRKSLRDNTGIWRFGE